MLSQPPTSVGVKENYVAFAPGFSDEVKNKYLSVIKDSVNLDYSYLRLLPQPATNKLTKEIKGRPRYQDGEGMVSLAHAFNYAGSQHILTALWKIDEQSSSQITSVFIQNLKKGLATDEALREAKLQYLQQSNGRLLAPSYWAGLVMMGEPVHLSFNPSTNYTFWIAGGVLLVGLIAVFFLRKPKKSK
jgi:hypothetical protein